MKLNRSNAEWPGGSPEKSSSMVAATVRPASSRVGTSPSASSTSMTQAFPASRSTSNPPPTGVPNRRFSPTVAFWL